MAADHRGGGPVRIAMLSHMASPLAPTGAERSLALLASGLTERGHQVAVAAPGVWALDTVLESVVVRATIPCRCCWLTAHEPQPLPMQVLRAARFALPDGGRRALARWLRQLQPHVVHVNCLPHLRGAAAAGDAGVPVVWHLREILPPGRRRRWFAEHLRRHADRLVAVSEAVAAWLREEDLGDRVEVVHNGVVPPQPFPDPRVARETLAVRPDDVVVGLFGQLIAHKGVLDLVQAGRLAAQRRPELRFVIAGAGSSRFVRQVKQAVAATGLAERFQVLPPQVDVWDLMAATDVVVLTTRTPDPLPRAVLEGMAAGRPVVAYDSGGVGEMVVEGETGMLVPTGDVQALAERLVLLADDPLMRLRMGRLGHERARLQFSVRRHLDAMERVLIDTAGS